MKFRDFIEEKILFQIILYMQKTSPVRCINKGMWPLCDQHIHIYEKHIEVTTLLYL